MRLVSCLQWIRSLQASRMTVVISLTLAFQLLVQVNGKERPMKYRTLYRTIQIDGLSPFSTERPVRKMRRPFFLLARGQTR